ncbi:7014_t:CDS:1, partial [Acaulospora colombiana]
QLPDVKLFVRGMDSLSEQSGVEYTPLPTITFITPPPEPPKNLREFQVVAFAEHTKPYYEQSHIKIPDSPFPSFLEEM